MHDLSLACVVQAYKQDPDSVYQTWFLNSGERLKAFRSIRRGVEQVVLDIRAGTFGNDFRDSTLETVLNSITEQKQVFEGAAHPFYWKPKLRIPDIYENDANKTAFGQFLEECLHARNEDQLLRAIARLSALNIKGLGPAVGNILYFLQPTLMPPFNTAMLNGFNTLFAARLKLGSWDSYLELRQAVLRFNEQFRLLLSKDLGAVSGLLFEIGVGRLVLEGNAELVLERERRKTEAVQAKRHEEVRQEQERDETHTQMQYLLTRMGKSLGYDVAVAANDRSKSYGDDRFSSHCLCEFPDLRLAEDTTSTIELIDVLWFQKGADRIACAFEVEKTTSIYSGILRLRDLTLAVPDHNTRIFLVAPDERERQVVAQLQRPSLATTAHANISYILFSDLIRHWDSICRFGADCAVLDKIAKRPPGRP